MAMAVVATLLASPMASAWGQLGHEVVAEVAWTRLGTAERVHLDSIFAGAGTIYGNMRGEKAMQYASIWPDLLREGHQHGGHMDVPLVIFKSLGANSSANRKVDNLHFADFDENGRVSPSDDVIIGVRLALQALRDKGSSGEARGEALSFLVHLVGDAHQPLHCARRADYGGNTIAISGLGENQERTELHAVWDSGMLRLVHISQAREYVSARLLPVIPQVASGALLSLNPETWARESNTLANEAAYVNDDGSQIQSGDALSQAYVDRNILIVDKRLAEAGVRLGAVLTGALTPE
jgi:hypothetical protein